MCETEGLGEREKSRLGQLTSDGASHLRIMEEEQVEDGGKGCLIPLQIS